MTNSQTFDDLDDPRIGAEAIAKEAKLYKDDDKGGGLDVRLAFSLLEMGFIDASKAGRQWVSTPRRIKASFASPKNVPPLKRKPKSKSTANT